MLALAQDVSLELLVLNATRVVLINDLEEGVHILTLHTNLQLGNQVSHLIDCQGTRLVQVEVVEDLAQKVGVSASQLHDSILHLSQQV